MSDWHPKLRDSVEFVQPPAKIELTLETPQKGDDYVVLPAAGAAPSVHSWNGWKVVSSKKVHIFFSTGFVGVEMFLEPAGNGTLKGKARSFWDYTNRRESSFVTAKPISCVAPFITKVPAGVPR
jgi:hypothetical protein